MSRHDLDRVAFVRRGLDPRGDDVLAKPRSPYTRTTSDTPSWSATRPAGKSRSPRTRTSTWCRGTGAVEVTPAHDPNDFEIGKRHDRAALTITDERGTAYGPLQCLDRLEARPAVARLAVGRGPRPRRERPRAHVGGPCSRCKTVVGPRVSLQWFVRIEPCAAADGALRIDPQEMGPRTRGSRWILSRLSSPEVDAYGEKFEVAKACETLHHFAWDEFCDWYVPRPPGMSPHAPAVSGPRPRCALPPADAVRHRGALDGADRRRVDRGHRMAVTG
jgi:tRNA synthetases class I (I, L, M and V)/Anticodon-binding domain of tRNA ligase